MARPKPRTKSPSHRQRFITALVLATALHALWIFGLDFKLELRAAPRVQRSLEIMVVRRPQPTPHAEEADYLAETSQNGGGETKPKQQPKSPAAASSQATPEPIPVPGEAPPPEPPRPQPPAPRVITAERAPETVPDSPSAPPPREPAQRELPSISELLASRRREANRITAELAQEAQLSAMRPRRKHISASTQEYKYAAYLDAWRRKVERIGNLNYPPEAKQRNLYGNLVLTVELRADGSVEAVHLLRSSGHQLLDDSAIRIVRMASPYAPFPPEIREETDFLEITRTWQFLGSKQLFSSD